MIEDRLIFIKTLLFKIINYHIHFSHIRQFRNFYLKIINNEFMVSLNKNVII